MRTYYRRCLTIGAVSARSVRVPLASVPLASTPLGSVGIGSVGGDVARLLLGSD
jgi:hypothetical protein